MHSPPSVISISEKSGLIRLQYLKSGVFRFAVMGIFNLPINLPMLVGLHYMSQVSDHELTLGKVPTPVYLSIAADCFFLKSAVLEFQRHIICPRGVIPFPIPVGTSGD